MQSVIDHGPLDNVEHAPNWQFLPERSSEFRNCPRTTAHSDQNEVCARAMAPSSTKVSPAGRRGTPKGRRGGGGSDVNK